MGMDNTHGTANELIKYTW